MQIDYEGRYFGNSKFKSAFYSSKNKRRRKKKKKKQNKIVKTKIIKTNNIIKKKPYGNFKVKYLDDNEIVEYIIGENINDGAPIIGAVCSAGKNTKISIGLTEIEILENNIYYK